ncbi:MAG: hypothetical protein ACTHU0_21775 [Kofleriaceae bacterium]
MKATQRGVHARRWTQGKRFWRFPDRASAYDAPRPQHGWAGGRDRDKPRKHRYALYRHGRWVGGVMQYEAGGLWTAYVRAAGTDGADVEATFGQRWRAKRWVEKMAARAARG